MKNERKIQEGCMTKAGMAAYTDAHTCIGCMCTAIIEGNNPLEIMCREIINELYTILASSHNKKEFDGAHSIRKSYENALYDLNGSRGGYL